MVMNLNDSIQIPLFSNTSITVSKNLILHPEQNYPQGKGQSVDQINVMYRTTGLPPFLYPVPGQLLWCTIWSDRTYYRGQRIVCLLDNKGAVRVMPSGSETHHLNGGWSQTSQSKTRPPEDNALQNESLKSYCKLGVTRFEVTIAEAQMHLSSSTLLI